jgi:hypothetical protein
MDHGRLRELEWQRDDLFRRTSMYTPAEGGWFALMRAYYAAQEELLRAL